MKKAQYRIGFSLLLFLSGLSSACQKQSALPDQAQPNFVLAKTSNELIALRADPKANLIRTLAEYDAVVSHTPLSKLPREVQAEFRRHIMVREGVGVVGVRYNIIQPRLTEDEFAQVMALFGIDTKQGYWGFSTDPKVVQAMNQAIDSEIIASESGYKDHCCEKPYTCKQDVGSTCLACQ